jgi:hypothetical protein
MTVSELQKRFKTLRVVPPTVREDTPHLPGQLYDPEEIANLPKGTLLQATEYWWDDAGKVHKGETYWVTIGEALNFVYIKR